MSNDCCLYLSMTTTVPGNRFPCVGFQKSAQLVSTFPPPVSQGGTSRVLDKAAVSI